jgi:hypothetical protein
MEHIYLAYGHTNRRKSIDGLTALVVSRFHLASHLTIELEHGTDIHGQREDMYGHTLDDLALTIG